MATALSNLLALLALDNSSYMDGLAQSKKAADIFGGNLASVGGAVVLGALTAAATAVIGIGSAAFDAAETLDEAYDKIAVATGATGPALDALKDDFDAVFAAIPTDATAAATAIGILNSRLEWTGPVLQDTASSLLEMTRLLGGDLVANGEAFTRMVGDWGLNFEDLPVYMDAVFVASQQTGANVSTLMQQIVQYGAPMRNFGFSFEQAGALLAKFAAEGVNTEIVMSGMRIAQGKFINSGVDMATGLWDTVDAIQNATGKTEGLAIATEVFGAKAAGDMYDTIVAGKFDIDGLTESMLNADGAILDAAAATSDWGEKWKIFQNKMTLALGPLGEKLREGMGKALDDLLVIFERPDVQAAIERFTNFAVTTISAIVAYIPTLIGSITSFVDYLTNNQGIVIGVFTALGVAAVVWGVVTAAAAWAAIAPLLPVIAVLALVAAAAYFLYQAWVDNFGGIQGKVQGFMDALRPVVDNIIEWFSSRIPTALQGLRNVWGLIMLVLGEAWATIGPSLSELWKAFTVNIPLVKEALMPLLPMLSGLASTILPILGKALAVIVVVLVGVVNGLVKAMTAAVKFFPNILDAVALVLEGIINVVDGWLKFMHNLILGDGHKAMDGLVQMLKGVLQVLGGFLALLAGVMIQNLLVVWGFVSGFVEGIVGFFQNMYDKLVGHSIIPDLVKKIVDIFTKTDWLSLGKNVVDGIVNGILNGISAIIDAATRAAKAALNAAKNYLGIKSPSKLFEMQVGYQMAVGLAKGWEGGLAALFNPMLVAAGGIASGAGGIASGAGGIASGAGGSPQSNDMLVMEEIRRMLRDLPNEIARVVTAAAAKMPRSR